MDERFEIEYGGSIYEVSIIETCTMKEDDVSQFLGPEFFKGENDEKLVNVFIFGFAKLKAFYSEKYRGEDLKEFALKYLKTVDICLLFS